VVGAVQLNPEKLREVVLLATSAPSIHNTQPWRWHAAGDVLDLHADRSRGLPQADAAGRQLLTSCGAALLFARVALRATGRAVRWQLLPDRLDHDHLARLTIGGEFPAEPTELAFARAIDTRSTGPDPFEARPLAPDLRGQLGTDAAVEGAWLHWIDSPTDRAETGALVSRAARIRRADPAYLGELRHWQQNDSGGHPAAVGRPTATGLAPAGTTSAASGPTRNGSGPANGVGRPAWSGSGRPAASNGTALAASAAAAARPTGNGSAPGTDGVPPEPAGARELVVVGTDHEGPASWLLAGQAAGRMLLRLTVGGAAAVPVDPVLDLPWTREQVRRQLKLLGFPQLLLRLGYPTRSPVRSPRRPVADVLTIDAPV
jgi:nitroreductase